jgi:hypothetical protein
LTFNPAFDLGEVALLLSKREFGDYFIENQQISRRTAEIFVGYLKQICSARQSRAASNPRPAGAEMYGFVAFYKHNRRSAA